MDIFVTGAGGFIGSHLVEALVQKGHSVTALVQYNSLGREEWLDTIDRDVYQKIKVVSGDVRDLAFVRRAMENCEAVMHLAALIGIPYSYVNPESYIDTNIKGTMNVLEAARDHGVKKIIHTSTSETYGSALYVPIDEKHPMQGQSPYSASKIAADQMAYAYACSFEMPVVTIRPFNTYGPRQSLRAVIPTVISQLLKGDVVHIGQTSPTRDFSYVEDTAAGFISALEADADKIKGEVINLGSNFEISVGDTIQAIADVLGKTPEIICEQERVRPEASEVQRLFADNSKAKTLLNWSPQYEGLDGFKAGLEKTISWLSEEKNKVFYEKSGYVI